MEFQEKRKTKKILYSKVTLFILCVLVFFILRAVWSVYGKYRVTVENLDRAKENLTDLKKREDFLMIESARLQTAGGVDQEIRDKYGLVKPGEEVIVIVDKDNSTSTSSVVLNRTFWQKVLDWLK